MTRAARSDTQSALQIKKRVSICRVMRWTGLILLLLPGLYLLELSVSNWLSQRHVLAACTAEKVFRVTDAQKWSDLKQAARRQLLNGARTPLVALKRPVWKQDGRFSQVHHGNTIIRIRDVEVAWFNDVAYAPRSILTDLHLLAPANTLDCSWQLYIRGDLGAKIIYDFSEVELGE